MKQQVAIISSVGSNLASLKFALDRLDVNYCANFGNLSRHAVTDANIQ